MGTEESKVPWDPQVSLVFKDLQDNKDLSELLASKALLVLPVLLELVVRLGFL